MKRSFSCPSPTHPLPLEPESPLRRSTPPHHFKVPHYPSRSRRTPKQRKPRPPRRHPYQHSDHDYPSLPLTNPNSSSQYVTSSPSSSSFSYAQVTQPRAGKRCFSERICLSPIDHLPKRHAPSGLQSTPPEPLLTRLNATPKDHFTEELMDICDGNETTPGGER